MCCFSNQVDHVSDTQIFVRGSNGSQFIVYSMRYAAPADLAMVLPIPVTPNPAEDAVRFISLAGYREFFHDMRRGFPDHSHEGATLQRAGRPLGRTVLAVHDIGAFEASFVPRMDDFVRLDPRFRISPDVWAKRPVYRDYGFAVFKLKGTTAALHVHPMALEFPRRHPELLFFPTLHVHDNEMHENAVFDHTLYVQADSGETRNRGWQRTSGKASEFIHVHRTNDVVDGRTFCWRIPVQGRLANRDLWVRTGEKGPEFTGAPEN